MVGGGLKLLKVEKLFLKICYFILKTNEIQGMVQDGVDG